jgi:hypothetical protein
MTLNQTIVKRLALVRHLYHLGVRQSRQPEPLRALSLLMFHDAIELFFDAAASHHGQPQPPPKARQTMFDAYLDALDRVVAPATLPERAALGSLNKARVSLKHHGLTPGSLDIEQHRGTATGFLKTSTPMLFGADVDFDLISMSDALESALAREIIQDAETLMAKGETTPAMLLLQRCLGVILSEFELSLAIVDLATGPVREANDDPARDDVWHHGGRTVHDAVRDLTASVSGMQEMLRIVALGLDVRRYYRYVGVIARVVASTSGRAKPVSAAHFHYCRDFVVETALALQQFERELDDNDEGGT